jgi:phospholipase C
MSLSNIDHIVVCMFENRSLDNMLGFLYTPSDLPKQNIPPQNPPTFDGLAFGGPWTNPDSDGTDVPASMPTTQWPTAMNKHVVPSPDPGEPFDDVREQIGDPPKMKGFIANYANQKDVTPENRRQIMQSYSPAQLPVLSTLARAFAVSDEWFCSMPTQTWPNRSFAHTGSSDGNVINKPYIPYDINTIFTTLNAIDGGRVSWRVYHDTIYTPSLTRIQFLKHLFLPGFERFDRFLDRCNAPANAPASMKLPAYSFIEPRFIAERMIVKVHHSEDYHPPHNILHAEAFLASVYNAVKTSPYRDRILLLITFDEHGGTYDHVVPKSGAKPPAPKPVAKNGFRYDMFGVRVPTIIVSSYVQPGTVFRSETGVPYDHTSILATLRDWQQIPPAEFMQFLPSPRIAAAPTFDGVLTESTVTATWPDVTPPGAAIAPSAAGLEALAEPMDFLLDEEPDDLEISIAVATDQFIAAREGKPLAAQAMAAALAVDETLVAEKFPTRRDVMEHVRQTVLEHLQGEEE